MLKRLTTLIGFAFFWMVSALIFPILFWVISGIILTLVVIHVIREGEGLQSGARFFTIVGGVTALLATGGFFIGGDAEAEPTELSATAGDLDDDDDGEEGEEGDAEEEEGAAEEPDGQVTKTVDAKAVIKAAKAVAKKKKDCKSLDAIAEAWKYLAFVPTDDKDFGKAKKAAKGLEGCRKKAATALMKTAAKTRLKARNALVKEVKKELASEGMKVKPKATGKGKTKLVLKGNKKITEEQINEAFESGSTEEGTLLGRLQAVGFEKITVTAGKLSRDFELSPDVDDAEAAEQLEVLGLDEPISL